MVLHVKRVLVLIQEWIHHTHTVTLADRERSHQTPHYTTKLAPNVKRPFAIFPLLHDFFLKSTRWNALFGREGKYIATLRS